MYQCAARAAWTSAMKRGSLRGRPSRKPHPPFYTPCARRTWGSRENIFMKQIHTLLLSSTLAALLATQLAACGAEPTTPAAAQPQATAVAQSATSTAAQTLDVGINAIGEVKPIQDANLTFQVAGT